MHRQRAPPLEMLTPPNYGATTEIRSQFPTDDHTSDNVNNGTLNSSLSEHDPHQTWTRSFPPSTPTPIPYAGHVAKTILTRSRSESQMGLVTREDSTDQDVLRVEICDLEASVNTTQTIVALQTCKKQIVYPFTKLLIFVGWRPVGYSNFDYSTSCLNRFLNLVYLTFLLGIMLFAYVYQTIACQWKLNIMLDTGLKTLAPSIRLPTTHAPVPNLTTPIVKDLMLPYDDDTTTTDYPTKSPSADATGMPVCEHQISTYIVPNVLHMIAYLVGFWHFRVRDSEDIYALMEKVFQYCATLAGRQRSQIRLMGLLRFYGVAGLIWLLLALSTHILYDLAFAAYSTSVFALCAECCPEHGRAALSYGLLAVDMIGYLAITVVSASVIFSYVVHCELVIFYVNTVCDKLQMRSINLKVARSDMLNIKNSVGHLNGEIGIMTSFILVIFAEMITIGLIVLIMNKYPDPLIWTYRAIFVMHLIPVFLFPLIQAARVNSKCHQFKTAAVEMRTFGYQNAKQADLDSFLVFTMANTFCVKLFRLPIRSSYLVVITVASGFVLLLLSQTGQFGRWTLF